MSTLAGVVAVADEAWLAAALLHLEHPERDDFTVKEIVRRAADEAVVSPLRKGVEVHVYLHCVANKQPNPGQYRMLYATGKSTRRLYREGDETHPKRHGKITPERDAIPREYHYLLEWYRDEYAARQNRWLNGLFELAGAGKEVFAGRDADDYVRQLREGWD